MHHRKSIRLKGYDYSQAGLYFITICCQDRIHRFGQVESGTMILNEFGIVAYNEWMNTSKIRENVILGEFVIMPNHMHGIIRILRTDDGGVCETPLRTDDGGGYVSDDGGVCETPLRPEDGGGYVSDDGGGYVSDDGGVFKTPLRPEDGGVFKTPLRSPTQTVGAIVRGYKSSVTKQLGLLGFKEKLWQRNYYEHIIRDEKSYQNISEYIINNPAKWAEDKFYKL
ncbi:transposase [Gelidibacter sp.]|uniref:transposase n=1 Tax=Gelidibacter sp. TaxID=2018083 RepID=UPI002BBD7A83|nr:transposase [Gelidibacter sp.]HUH28031.1 transposase [Gelidibacter sp.]